MAQCLTHLEIQSPWDVCVFDFLIEEHLVIFRISSFALNPRRNSPYSPFPSEQTHTHTHKKKHGFLPAADGMVLWTPRRSAHLALGVLAVLSECNEALVSLRPTSVILSHLPGKRGGPGTHSGGPKKRWAGLWERSPSSAGWSGWMRVTTVASAFAKSLLKLTMRPVEGADEAGNWG